MNNMQYYTFNTALLGFDKFDVISLETILEFKDQAGKIIRLDPEKLLELGILYRIHSSASIDESTKFGEEN